MHRRLSYANVVATLALVFAMSGGALAAKHYLINSTKQINPKVLKKLKGTRGKAGATGKEGPTGKQGPEGKQGLEGKQGAEGKQEPVEAISANAASVGFPLAAKAAEVVTEVKLTAGSYTLLATVEANNTSAAGAEVECVFLQEGSTNGATAVTPGAKARESIALSGVLTLTAPAALKLACKSSSTEGDYVNPTLTATKVAQLG